MKFYLFIHKLLLLFTTTTTTFTLLKLQITFSLLHQLWPKFAPLFGSLAELEPFVPSHDPILLVGHFWSLDGEESACLCWFPSAAPVGNRLNLFAISPFFWSNWKDWKDWMMRTDLHKLQKILLSNNSRREGTAKLFVLFSS